MPFMTSILDCCSDFSGCMDVFFCLPCNVGRQYGAVNGMEDQLQCCPCLLTMIAVTSVCVNINLRRTVVEKYMLEESCCGSVLCGFFCFPCSVCQTNRELNLRGARTGHTCCAPSSAQIGAAP
ncbi:Hypothetical protein, putative [Bodo saltans]|uniref:Uncharacterized protein n=1 Tax=Bodo saltans TaxID=75058 RepID=A0A0S4IRB7_BODSA|nr:Hypothetical protein, putative [Bodo saltans]|eukprot:CUE73366.1 Hypothetical protein, putative [Bodo saltans]